MSVTVEGLATVNAVCVGSVGLMCGVRACVLYTKCELFALKDIPPLYSAC